MNSYIDVTLRPSPELPVNRLMNTVYSNLHKILFDLNSTDIGVSFPDFRVTLGNKLRVHGQSTALEMLEKTIWLGGVNDRCSASEISQIPKECSHRVISRVQSNMTQSKLNRLLKRGSISNEDARKYKAKMFAKGLDAPYLELVSGSNGHKHRRYISFGPLTSQPTEGEFDQFGLSKTATVPWFD
jgi:CRISPR-associated endonuclease Csy4